MLTQVRVWNFDWLRVRFEVWNDFSTLVIYLGWRFAIELILLFLNVSLKFWVWWLLCNHGYDWVCLIEMGMANLDWVLLKFCNFWGQFFFFKELYCVDFLEFGWLSLRWIVVLYWLHLVEIWWFVNLAQWFCFSIYELIQVWKFCLNLNLFALSWNYCLWWFF